jgi:hypothetical protein
MHSTPALVRHTVLQVVIVRVVPANAAHGVAGEVMRVKRLVAGAVAGRQQCQLRGEPHLTMVMGDMRAIWDAAIRVILPTEYSRSVRLAISFARFFSLSFCRPIDSRRGLFLASLLNATEILEISLLLSHPAHLFVSPRTTDA